MKKRVNPSRAQAHDVRRVKARLLPLLPRGTRVDIEVWGGGGISGLCWLAKKRHWKIRVNADLDEVGFIDTLLHEFAHAIAGIGVEPEGDHGPLWGVCYALCYRTFHERRSIRANRPRN